MSMSIFEKLSLLGTDVEVTKRKTERLEREIVDLVLMKDDINISNLKKLREQLIVARVEAGEAYNKFIKGHMGD